MKNKIEQFDVVLATFRPNKIDDLNEIAKKWVGSRMKWTASWRIDMGNYEGEMAMTPFEKNHLLGNMGWVPFSDLTDVVWCEE